MKYKKTLSFLLAVLFLFGTTTSVGALTPPYSESFDNKEDMLTSIYEYAESYPNIEGQYFEKNIIQDDHLEYREVIVPEISDGGYLPISYDFGASTYGECVDYTTTFFAAADDSIALRILVYYGYNNTEIYWDLNATKTSVSNRVVQSSTDEYKYVAAETIDINGNNHWEYHIAIDDKLVIIYTEITPEEFSLYPVTFEYTDVFIPVKIRDSAEWFKEAIQKDYVIGDTNSDGKLNVRDATVLQKYCAKLSEVNKLMADFNGDLKIDIKDVTDIQKKLTGLDYTCRRELYPVSRVSLDLSDEIFVESQSHQIGPFSDSELALIMDYGNGGIDNYTTVFKSVEEFKAFFGKTVDAYDDEYFENNALVYVYRNYYSSSCNIEPDMLWFADGVLEVVCIYSEPDIGEPWQEAIGNYNLFFEVNKADIEGLRGIEYNEYTMTYF